MIPYYLLFALLLTAQLSASLRCNQGSNYKIKTTTCVDNASFCVTTITVDNYQTETIVRDCDYENYCSRGSIGNNQWRNDSSGMKTYCCNSDLCNDKPARPTAINCWAGGINSKKSTSCSSGFCSKVVYPNGAIEYGCDKTTACLEMGNTCSPAQPRSDSMTVCCCNGELCNFSPRSVAIEILVLLSSLVAVVFCNIL